MKTVALTKNHAGGQVVLELNELELTSLVALVEQGQLQLRDRQQLQPLYARMTAIADEFCSLLGHLELVPVDE